MANLWFRLWHDMPTDPKFRTIARASKQPLSLVIAVYLHVLVDASNANERGRTQSLSTEDVASALDVDTEQVEIILQEMQGRLLENDKVTGWDKRQPKKEDGASERAKAWREAKKQESEQQLNNSERDRTQANAKKRPDKDTDKDKDKENKEKIIKKEVAVFKVKDLIAEGLSEETAKELHAFRTRKKAAITPYVWKHFLQVAKELGLAIDDAAREWILLNSQGFEAEWVRNRKGQNNARASPKPMNKQEALEARNKAVGDEWLRKKMEEMNRESA